VKRRVDEREVNITKKHMRLEDNKHGTSGRQYVNIQPMSQKSLAELTSMLGDARLLQKLQASAHINTLQVPITATTRVNTWDSICIQISKNVTDLQCLQAYALQDLTDPTNCLDPVLYVMREVDPASAALKGT
jgi:hypothetical protein